MILKNVQSIISSDYDVGCCDGDVGMFWSLYFGGFHRHIIVFFSYDGFFTFIFLYFLIFIVVVIFT